MVEVRTSRIVGEVLAAEGDVAGTTRLFTSVLAVGDQSDEVQVTRLAAEVLGDEPDVATATRLFSSVLALGDQPDEVQISRIVGEVLASSPPEMAATRLFTSVLALGNQTDEVQISRLSAEVLARQGSAGPVTPLALSANSHIFLHNWATEATMETSFRTDVTRSPDSGAESRRGLGVKPTRLLDLEWSICSPGTPSGVGSLVELERLEVLLRRMTDGRFQVPIYMDQQELAAAYVSTDTMIMLDTTTSRFFEGQRIAIVQLGADNQIESHSFHIIASKSNMDLTLDAALGVNVAQGSLVFPMMDCETVLEVEMEYVTARYPVLKMTVVEAPGMSQLPPLKSDNPTGADIAYDGRPVWMEEPDWASPVIKGRSRDGKRSRTGRADLVTTFGDRSRQTHQFVISGKRAEMWNALEFFETRRGRLRSFWHIDQDQYFDLVEIDVSGMFAGVNENDLDLTDTQEEFDALGLVMEDGSHYVRDVSIISSVLTKIRFDLNTSLPSGLLVADGVRIARARLVRFVGDTYTETWTHTGFMEAEVQIIEVLNEGDFTI